jgi:voltage-gated potassium channel
MADHKKKNGIAGHGFRNLLFFLLVYIVVSPFLAPYPSFNILAHAALSVALFVAAYAVQKQEKQRSYAMALLLPLLILYWLGIYNIVPFSRLVSYLLFAVYFGLLVYSYAVQIARSRRVTTNVLYGTFCLYLIVGLFWGSLYMVLHELSPGSYSGVLLDKAQGSSFHIFNYFSMVTLTSLGYGDITPQTPGAASLCQFEALVGQFFTAVLVAWLVGMFMFEKQEKRAKSREDG